MTVGGSNTSVLERLAQSDDQWQSLTTMLMHAISAAVRSGPGLVV